MVSIGLMPLTSEAQTLSANTKITEQDILELFPKATVIGEKRDSPPVWPIYQLQELIGYAFESRDLSSLTGFSGDPIDLLIGIDAQGQFSGVKLMAHHEPIFLHGLGLQPLLDFIAQYRGNRVSDRIILKKPGTKTQQAASGTLYFDSVTKATVSIIVVNDTIMSSALKVARQTLEEFAQQAPARVRTEIYETRTWAELIQERLVERWQLSRETVEQGLGNSLSDYPDTEWSETPDTETIDLYFAYLNAPIVGKNLLGEQEFSRLQGKLKNDESAVFVMSQGFYDYIDPDFKPGTIPERFNLVQNGLPIPVRDLNFYNYDSVVLAKGAPVFDNARVFRIRPQTGFDPSAVMDLQLNFDIKKNHLVTDLAAFSQQHQLPERLFERQAARTETVRRPAWVTIWLSRIPEISILLIALVILSYIFVQQQTLMKTIHHYSMIRWPFLFFTLFFIGFYAQGQLSVINIFTLFLEILRGFNIGVFLLDPIIFILWVFTVISLVLWGRGVFCGWLCPFGALQEMVAWVAAKLNIKQWRYSKSTHQRLIKFKYVILVFLTGLSFYSLDQAMTLSEVEPFKTAITLVFIRSYPFVLYAVLLLGIGLYISKFYCRYVCPLGAGLALPGEIHIFEKLRRRSECGSKCQMCRNRCQIDAIDESGAINYSECIQCLECLAIINDKNQCAIDLLTEKKSRISNGIPIPIEVTSYSGTQIG